MARSRRVADVSGNCGDGQAAEPINQRRRHAQRTAPNFFDGSEQYIETPGQGSEPNVGGEVLKRIYGIRMGCSCY